MHCEYLVLLSYLRLFLAFNQKLCFLSFHVPKIDKRGGQNKSGGLENFSKINKPGRDEYSVLESTRRTKTRKYVVSS